MSSQRAGIALGSNLGDRVANLRAAVRHLLRLHQEQSTFLASSIYETEPRFCPPGSPVFMNAVVELAWGESPAALHAQTLRIESLLGRTDSPVRNAPRIIDLDILYVGDAVLNTETLQLPHPRIINRKFVLQPLAEIRPNLRVPGWRENAGEILRSLESDEAPARAVPDSLLCKGVEGEFISDLR